MTIEKVEKDLITLLNSDLSASKISRMADIPLSTITRLRNGKAQLDNISFINIKKLHSLSDRLTQL